MGVAEASTDDEVDVSLLLHDPRAALFPMLTKVRGWEEVGAVTRCRRRMQAELVTSHWDCQRPYTLACMHGRPLEHGRQAPVHADLNLLPWRLQATLDDIKVSQLSGAMTNLIYRCRYKRGAEVTIFCCMAPAKDSWKSARSGLL
jgi:hypothetical protein